MDVELVEVERRLVGTKGAVVSAGDGGGVGGGVGDGVGVIFSTVTV